MNIKKSKSKYLLSAGLFIVFVFFAACAKIGSPTGGPKDTTPPKVVDAVPPDSIVDFKPGKKITITFDEYIQLKDIYQELILSPPLDEKPIAYIRDKSIVVEFPAKALFDTTTYTLGFGNSISDNNEGNVLKGFEYVFSLNSFLDSMNVEGRVVNSFNFTPDKDRMFVILYKNLSDSAPLKERPNYICRTNEEGYFFIHNIKNGRYHLFALKDVNANLKYDLPDEQVAYYDSVIDLLPEKFTEYSIIDEYGLLKEAKNEFSTATDSIKKDSLQVIRKYLYYTEMLYFTKQSKNQYLRNNLRDRPELLEFMFNLPLEDSLQLRALNYNAKRDWYILDSNAPNDTLKYWLTDTAMASKDSLKFELRFPSYDSAGNRRISADTLMMFKKAEVQPRGFRIRKGKEKGSEELKKNVKRITLKNNISNPNAFDLNRNIEIVSTTPIYAVKSQKIKLFKLEDTVSTPVKIEVIHSLNSMYKFEIKYKPEERMKYKIFIPDSTITDIYGITNDTVIVPFTTQSEDFYGTLTMRISNIKEPVILQLMDEKEKLINEKFLKSDQTVRYDYMYPHKYILKIIVDSNGNGKWDTGNYLLKKQPERVIYYPQIINIRSNWEVDNVWDLKYH